MGCCLRAYGVDFDVDAFMAEYPIEVIGIWRKGEPRRPLSDPNGAKLDESGFNIDVSDTGFASLDVQVEDAIAYLSDKANAEIIRKLNTYPGIECIGLDFGITLRDGSEYPVQGYIFPAELNKLAGELGLDIALSVYFF